MILKYNRAHCKLLNVAEWALVPMLSFMYENSNGITKPTETLASRLDGKPILLGAALPNTKGHDNQVWFTSRINVVSPIL